MGGHSPGFMTVTRTIPVTEFASAERLPIEVVRRQASEIERLPLAACLLNSGINHVFILNDRRQVVWASQNAGDLAAEPDREWVFGKRPGEVLGCVHLAEEGAECGATDYCAECGAFSAILGGLAGEVTRRECRITRMIRCQPEALDLLISATPLEFNSARFVVVAIADIGHEKRRQAFERIFFHDLLASAGGLEGLLDDLKSEAPSTMQPMLELARREFLNMLEQVQAQRDLMAAERHDLQVAPGKVEACGFLRELVQIHATDPAAQGVRIGIEPGRALIWITTDRTLLRRVLRNLLNNAVEASKPGETVTVGCELAGGEARFWIRNESVMPPAIRHQIFNRSFSTKGAGHGLGTYSARLLTQEYLKGRVTFESNDGQGTTFSIVLPLCLPG